MRRRALSVMILLSLIGTLLAPAAAAAGGPGLHCEIDTAGTAAALTISGISGEVYSLQIALPVTGGQLSFTPDPVIERYPSFYAKLKVEESSQTAYLYLDSRAPLPVEQAVPLGTLHAQNQIAFGKSAALIMLNGKLVGENRTITVTSNVTDGGDAAKPAPDTDDSEDIKPNPNPNPKPDPDGGSGGGSSSGGSSGGSQKEISPNGVTNVSVAFQKDGSALLNKQTLSAAKSLEIKGDATLIFDADGLETLKKLGSDVTVRSMAVPASALSRSAGAQLNGAALYQISIAAGENAVKLQSGAVRVLVPFTGMGRPVAYLVGENGVTKIGAATLENGTASFMLPEAADYQIAVLDIVHQFSDVNSWYDGYINTMAASGVMNGISSSLFAPEKTMTRAELVTTLARLSGDALGGSADFADVPASAWFAPYVAWGKQSGVTSGVSSTLFQPDGSITREQMATMFCRFADYQGIQLDRGEAAGNFPDGAQISPFAVEAVTLMQQAGVLSGKGDGRFDPKGTATRAECAKMLAVIMQAMKK